MATARGLDQREDFLLVKYSQAHPAAEFLSVRVDEDGRFSADLFAEAGHDYTLEASTNLRDWTPVQRVFNETGPIKVTDPVTGSAPRFYRAVRQP